MKPKNVRPIDVRKDAKIDDVHNLEFTLLQRIAILEAKIVELEKSITEGKGIKEIHHYYYYQSYPPQVNYPVTYPPTWQTPGTICGKTTAGGPFTVPGSYTSSDGRIEVRYL